jgi:hypothetical protein
MISLRQSVAWRINIAHRAGLRASHFTFNPVAGLLPKKSVSAVLCGRNDNYTPDFKERLATCLDWAFARGLAEAVWVEWNPPAEQPLLAIELTRKYPSLRAFVVSERIHREVCANPAFKLMEYHAKNVGIRRATTEWVCGTNADIIWGADVFPWFSLLRSGVVYQTQRVDFRWSGEPVKPGLLRERIRHLNYYRDDYVPLDGAGDFTLAERSLWFRVGGYDEVMRKQKKHCDSRGVYQFLAHGATVARIGRTYHMDHPNSSGYGSFAKDGVEIDRQAGVPYRNLDNWGLADVRETPLQDRVWLLE